MEGSKNLKSLILFAAMLVIVQLCIGFGEIVQIVANDFRTLLISTILTFIFIFFALNEISITDNGYEKKYRFTLSILLISLLSLPAAAAILISVTGMTIYLIINAVRESRFDIWDILYRMSVEVIPTAIMARLFFQLGGKPGEINFPQNFLLILMVSLVNYLLYTFLTVAFKYFREGRTDKPLLKLIEQEYGWIIRYDLWQALFAVMFSNVAIIFLFNNWSMSQTPGTGLLGAGDYLYFLIWLVIVSGILIFPILERISAFRTFISFNSENIKNVIHDMQEGILILDSQGVIKNINPVSEKMFDTLFEIEIGKNFRSYLDILEEHIENGYVTKERILDALSTGTADFRTEIELTGSSKLYYQIMISSEINRYGDVTGSVVTISNVTQYREFINEINDKNIKLEDYRVELEKRYKELQDTQQQLIMSEKMAVIGQMVAGVAHEINTPLASIKSNVDMEEMMLQMVAPESADTVAMYKESANSMISVNKMALERIMEIVKSLKNFARLDEAEFQKVNIYEGIDNTLILINNQLGGRIKIVKEYAELPMIKCFPQQLNQVFLNIFVNAIQAIKGEGVITIRTRLENGKAYIGIRDTGSGIKKENLDKIFEPGFTTKGVGVGTGLGLSICYKIIEKHQGRIWADSEVGIGTEFIVELPAEPDKSEV